MLRMQRELNNLPLAFRSVVLNLFYKAYPFIKQSYQIYPQYIQWCSFLEIRN